VPPLEEKEPGWAGEGVFEFIVWKFGGIMN
jgi:hypothetical protein